VIGEQNMDTTPKATTQMKINDARRSSSIGLNHRQQAASHLETPFDQVTHFSLLRGCSTSAVISRLRSWISLLSTAASMGRSESVFV